MASDEQIGEAFDHAKGLLKTHRISCDASIADLKAWFEADTPFEDSSLDDIISNQFLVIHELVEIDEVRKMGLQIGKNTIVDNLEKVDEAHLKATTVELDVAFALGDQEHISSRLTDIQLWIDDPTVTPSQRKKYRRLLVVAEQMTKVAPVAGRIIGVIHK